MESMDILIKTSLLGTERQSIDKSSIPNSILPYVEAMDGEISDREDLFLKTAVLIINYHDSGKRLEKAHFKLPKPAEEEILPYCNEKSLRTLRAILDNGSSELLEYWLQKCIATNKIVPPESLIFLIEEGKKNLKTRHLIKKVIGKRGFWLAQFNEEWNFINMAESDVWEAGKPEERKQLLIYLRNTRPEEARTLLFTCWKEENAGNRAEFLKILSINLAQEDEELLKVALTDNSSKVKSVAVDMLSQLKHSGWIYELWEIGKSWVAFIVSKNLLQLTKEEIEVKMPSIFPAELKEKGFQELSDRKDLSDPQYWLLQFITLIPPSHFEKHFNLDPAKIIHLCSKDKFLKNVISGWIQATIRHKDRKWARILLEEKLDRNEYVKFTSLEEFSAMLNLLSPEDKIYFYQKDLIKKDFPFKIALIDLLINFRFGWDLAFTEKAIKDIVTESQEGHFYAYSNFISLAQYAHAGILKNKKDFEPKDETLKNKWHNSLDKFFNILEIRQETEDGMELQDR